MTEYMIRTDNWTKTNPVGTKRHLFRMTEKQLKNVLNIWQRPTFFNSMRAKMNLKGTFWGCIKSVRHYGLNKT